MDDYFQILIYLIIIFAFLNSLFRKKNKAEPPRRTNGPEAEPQNRYSTSDTEVSSKQSEYDILKEIEGMFKGESSPYDQRKMQSEIEKANMRKVPREEHTEDIEWHESAPSEHRLEKSWHSITQFKRDTVSNEVIEKEAEKFEQILAERNKEVLFPFDELRKKLNAPESLKDYIVVSEIIGKPKYLRR
jgi:hypothetical protein